MSPHMQAAAADRRIGYRVYRRRDDDSLHIMICMSRAELPILYWGDGRWVSTQYQTADARHRPGRALALVRGSLCS